MSETIDLLTVTATDHRDYLADKVDLWLTVRGSSFFTGRAALSKAKEVSKLVADLQAAGIAEDDLELVGVRAEVSTGMLTKSSSATYTLRARCRDLDKMADVLSAATAQKNVTMDRLDWRYPSLQESELEAVEGCLRDASARGRRMAAALGVEVSGVHRASHEVLDEEARSPALDSAYYGAPGGGSAMRRRAEVDLGMEVTHRKRVHYKVKVEFRLAMPEKRQ